MLETFGGRFNITERIFDKQDYSQVITESAKLTELAIRHIFYNFRYWLSSEDSRARFLSFEKEMETQKERKGVSFMEFLSKPTIGVGIKYYLLLCDKFPEHTWADKSLVKNFDTVNNLRNPASHAAPINPPQSQDAYEVLHSTKKILDRLNLLDEEMYTLGVPLQHYLVFRSIQEKFEVSDEEEQFKQIIHDACVIIPPLVHLLLDRLYFLLPLEYKIEILKIQSSDDANNKDFKSVMTDYQGFFYNVKPLADLLDTKSLLNDTEGILESISSETISRFKTAPYIGVLKTICTFLTKPDQKSSSKFTNLDPSAQILLDYSNNIKKLYLKNGNKIDANDRGMLKKTAGFSKEIPVENIETIVSLVVSNIEDHLLNFLTVGSSFGPFSEQSLKRDSAESNVQPVTDSEESIVEIEKQPKEKVKISLKRFVMALPVIVAAIVALIILNPFTEEFQAKYIQQMRYETKIKPFQKDLKKKGITLLNSNIYFKYLTSNQLQKVNTNDGLSLYPPQNFNISILLKSGTNEKKAQQFRSVIKYQSLLIWVIKLDDTFVLFETDNTNNEIYQGSDPYQTYIYAEINWKTLNRQIMRYHEKSGRINTIEYKGALLVFSNGTYREFLNNMPSQNDKPITSLSDYLNQLSIHNLFDAGEILEKHGLDFFVIGEMQP